MSRFESATTENSSTNPEDLDDIDDDDDDQTNSSQKIVTNIHKPKTSGKTHSNFDVQNLIKTNLKIYLNTSIPKDYPGFIQCHIKREKQGLSKGFSTTFSLYFDGGNENEQISLLIARKHLTIGGHSEYFIGTNLDNPIAKLRSTNLTSTEYILYDHQNSSNKEKQLAAIVYDGHIFGSKEPRKLTILLRDNESSKLKDNENIIDQWRSGHSNDLIELKNKTPVLNEETNVYTIDLFENRVLVPSHKNFQLITSNEDPENNIAMQFGRINEDTFALDYRYPLTAIQAFSIALSSFHNRFRS